MGALVIFNETNRDDPSENSGRSKIGDEDKDDDSAPPPLFTIIRRRTSSINYSVPKRKQSFFQGSSSYNSSPHQAEPLPHSTIESDGERQNPGRSNIRRGSDASQNLRRLSLISNRRQSKYQDRLAIGLNELTECAEQEVEKSGSKPVENEDITPSNVVRSISIAESNKKGRPAPGQFLTLTHPSKEARKTHSVMGGPVSHGNAKSNVSAAATAIESEDHRNRRFLIYDTARMLRSFRGDREKLHAIVSGLEALSQPGQQIPLAQRPYGTTEGSAPSSSNWFSLLTSETDLQFERPTDEQIQHDRRILVFLTLLDIAFELLCSSPDTLLSRSGPLHHLIADIEAGRQIQTIVPLVNPYMSSHGHHHGRQTDQGKTAGMGPMGRMPSLAEITAMMSEGRIRRFASEDLVVLSRKLFRCYQWERFTVLAQLLEPPISMNAFLAPQDICTAQQRELALRVSVINFHNVSHAERRVLFDSDVVENVKGTLTDLNAKRVEVSESVCDAALSLLASISECIEDPILAETHTRLLVDAAHVLWRFAEPYVRELKTPEDATLVKSLTQESIIVITLRAVHIILSEFPTFDTLFAVKASSKLSLVLECIGSFTDAAAVLRDTIERISHARESLGESSFAVRSVTCNVRFHPTFDLETLNWIEEDADLLTAPRQLASDLQLRAPVFGGRDGMQSQSYSFSFSKGASIFSKSTGPWSLSDILRMELPCEEVATLAAMFRCEIKGIYAALLKHRKQKEEEHFRLTRKRLSHEVLTVDFNEVEMEARCGENLVWRAILLSALAAVGPNLTIMKRHKLLKDACALLRKEHRIERHLLEVVSGRHEPYTNVPMTCPSPSFVRRTPTSITIRPNHISVAGPRSPKLVPEIYEVYCKRAGKSKVAFSDVGYFGTGIPVSVSKQNEITVSGLTPNRKYVFAVAAYKEDGTLLGRGIGESSEGIVAMLPMPLILCWGHFAEISDALDCDDIADESFTIMRDHFVEWTLIDDQLVKPPTSGNTGVNHEPVFRLRGKNIQNSSPTIIRSFMRAIFAEVDRRFEVAEPEVRSDGKGTRNVLEAQMTRLRASRDMMIAMELAAKIGDGTGILSSAFRIASYIVPLFQHGLEVPFAVHALLLAHSSIIANLDELENNRASAVRDVFVPITALLCKRLIAWYEYPSAIRLAEESLSLINIVIGAADLKILNSSYLEFQWTGYVQKSKNPKAVAIKKGSHHEFIYHTAIAESLNPNQGYTDIRKRMDIFCEYLESVIAQCNSIIKNVSAERKAIDAHTSLREIFSVLSSHGPDMVVTEMLRFRKNPRYLEIMVHCADWCMSSRLIESAARICIDTIDWMGMRNKYMSNVNATWSENAVRKEVIQRRKRRNLFNERKAVIDFDYGSDRKSRSRNRERKQAPEYDEEWEVLKHSLVDGARPRSRRRMKKSIDAERQLDEREGSPSPKRSAAASRAQSPASRTHSKGREKSKGKGSRPTSRERSTKSKSRSRSGSPNGSEAPNTKAAGAKVIGKKRRRMAQRNIILGHLPQQERDNIEKAVRVLDIVLGSLWKQKRHLRRLRVIAAFEAPWRSQLAIVQGQSLLSIYEKELFTKGVVAAGQNQSFAALPGRIMFSNLRTTHRGLASLTFSAEWNRSISEILQSYVQAVNIAARVGSWSQVLAGCQNLWKTTQYLARFGLLHSEFWQASLWRAFFLTGDKLMDMFENIRITQEDTSANRLAHGVTFSEKRFDISDFRKDIPIPAGQISMTRMEMQESRFFGFWDEMHGASQHVALDLAWVGEYLLFGLDLMKRAGKLHRLTQTAIRFDGLFGHTFYDLLAPILDYIKNFQNNTANNHDCDIHLSLHLLPGAPPPQYEEEASNDLRSIFAADSRPLPGSQTYHMLLKARALFIQCIGNHIHSDVSPITSTEVILDGLEAYENVLRLCQNESEESFIHAIASHEYADLLLVQGDRKTANAYWSKSVDILFGTTKTVAFWKKLAPRTREILPNVRCIILAGISVAKMAMIGYPHDLEKRSELVSFSSFLLSLPLQMSLPHPADPLVFANYVPVHLIPDFNFNSDPFICDPTQMSSLLLFICHSLIADNRHLEALPLVGVVGYIAAEVIEDETLFATSILLKADILLSLGLISMALERLVSIITGSSLLPRYVTFYQHGLSFADLRFEESESIFDGNNWELIRGLVNINLSEKLVNVYGRQFAWRFDICRASIVLKLLKQAHIEDPISFHTGIPSVLENAIASSSVFTSFSSGCSTSTMASAIKLVDASEYDTIYVTKKLENLERSFSLRKPIVNMHASTQNFGSTGESPMTFGRRSKKAADRDEAFNLIQRIENLITNISMQVEQERKEPGKDSKTLGSYLLLTSDLSADIALLRNLFDVAIYRCTKIKQALAVKIPEIDAYTVWGPQLQLQTCSKIAHALLATGYFEVAQKLATEAKENAIKLRGLSYQIHFHGVELIAKLRLIMRDLDKIKGAIIPLNTTAESQPSSDGEGSRNESRKEKEFETCLAGFSSLLGEAKVKHVDKMTSALGWEVLGDILKEAKQDHIEAICLAYDMAQEAAASFLTSGGTWNWDMKSHNKPALKFSSSYSSYIPVLARIQLKRSWSAQAIADTVSASQLLKDSLALSKLSMPVLPRILIPSLVMSLGKISFYLRENTKPSSDSFNRLSDIGISAFLDLIGLSNASSPAGYGLQFGVLRSALMGVVSMTLNSKFADETHLFALETIKISGAYQRMSTGKIASESYLQGLTNGKNGSRPAFEPFDSLSPTARDAVIWKAKELGLPQPLFSKVTSDISKVMMDVPPLPWNPLTVHDSEEVPDMALSNSHLLAIENESAMSIADDVPTSPGSIQRERSACSRQVLPLSQRDAIEYFLHLTSLQPYEDVMLCNDAWYSLLGTRQRVAYQALLTAIGTSFTAAIDVDLSTLKETIKRLGNLTCSTASLPHLPSTCTPPLSTVRRNEVKGESLPSCVIWLPYHIKKHTSESISVVQECGALTMLLCFGPVKKKTKLSNPGSAKIEGRKSKSSKEPGSAAEATQRNASELAGSKQGNTSVSKEKSTKSDTMKLANTSRPSTASQKPMSPNSPQPSKKISVDNIAPESSAQWSTTPSRRQSVMIDPGRDSLETPYNQTISYSKHLARVPFHLINKIKSLCRSIIVNLKKFHITTDNAFKALCDKEFQTLKSMICRSLCGDLEAHMLKVEEPELQVEILYSIQKVFETETGHVAESVHDDIVFSWLQSVSMMRVESA
ncbi:hypothetical protein HDU67_008654 [Dinochytrium kinnereticum]|nr:hypothetical protein HDU67_008654 [Dinochytrium kinnereticum]